MMGSGVFAGFFKQCAGFTHIDISGDMPGVVKFLERQHLTFNCSKRFQRFCNRWRWSRRFLFLKEDKTFTLGPLIPGRLASGVLFTQERKNLPRIFFLRGFGGFRFFLFGRLFRFAAGHLKNQQHQRHDQQKRGNAKSHQRKQHLAGTEFNTKDAVEQINRVGDCRKNEVFYRCNHMLLRRLKARAPLFFLPQKVRLSYLTALYSARQACHG